MQPVCSSQECMYSHAARIAERSRKKREVESKKKKAEEKRRDKARIGELDNSKLFAAAQRAVNTFVRLRDNGLGCISCEKDKNWHGQWHAGHFKSVGANSNLRFNVKNINKQCSVCNNYNSGNVAEYERGIVKRYGQERLDWLNCQPRLRKFTNEYLVRIAKIFNKKTRILKQRKGI